MNIQNQLESEEVQSIINNTTEGLFRSTLDGRYLKVNPAMARIFGYESPDDMIKSVTDITKQIHVDEATREQFVEVLAKHESVEGFEARNYRKDRTIIWTRTNACTVRDEKGNILYFEGFLTDITSHKEAELALRASEERYRALVDRLPGVVFIDAPNDSEHSIYVSPKIEDILGYSPDEWTSEFHWSDILHPEDRERILVENKRADESGELFRQEYRVQKKGGEYIWLREESSLVKDKYGKPLFWQGFFLDITEQKKAESAILQSEQQFKKIFQANPIASFIATLDEGRFIAANDAYWELSGFKPNKFLGHTSVELGFLSKRDRNKFVARLIKEKSLRNQRGMIITRSGETRNTLEFFDMIRFDGQECILSMLYDITDQVKAQAALLENEEKYRQLFESESDAIFLIDNESGTILESNAAAAALYGYSKEELLERKNSDLSAEPEETRRVTRKTPIEREGVISIPLRYHKKKDGTVFPVEITGRFFEWRGRQVHIAAIRDITERKRGEEALRQSERNFRNIVEHTTNIYYSHTPEHTLTFMSPQTREILGYEPEEALINWHGFLNDNPLNEEGVKLTQKAIDTGKRQKPYILELKRKDGQTVWVEVNESPIVEKSRTIAVVGSLTDITERKRAEDKLNHQLNELTILHTIALAASSSRSLDELIQRATETVYNSLYPANCGVELVTARGDMYQAHPSYRGASKDEIRVPIFLTKGVTGKVITSGKAIRIGDVKQEPAYVEVTKGVRSELCVPIKIQNRVIGAFNIEAHQPDAFSEADERLLNTIAGTMATAIEQLRLFETSQRQLQELTILNAVSLASAKATNVDELIEKVTHIIGESLYPDNFGVLLFNKKENCLYPHPSYRGRNAGKFPVSISLGQGISGQVAASGKPLRITNVRNHPDYIEVTSQVHSELCVPIAHGDWMYGVINAESLKIDAFTEDDEQLLSTIASTLATALEKLRLFETEQKQRQDAEILREATTALTTSLNLHTLLDIILENLYRIVPYDSASIAMKKDGELYIIADRGFPDNYEVLGKRIKSDGVWTAIGKKRCSIIISDVQSDPEFKQWEGSDYIRGWMGVSMIAHGKVIGYFFIDSYECDAFTEKDATLVETFAQSAAVAIENARLFEAEQLSRQEAETLREATAALTSSLDLRTLLETILDSLARVVYYDSASVILAHEEGMEIFAARNLPEDFDFVGKRFKKNDKWQHFFSTRKPLIISDAKENRNFEKWSDKVVIRGWMGIPLVNKDQVIGYLSLDNQNPNTYSEADANLVHTFAHQAAIAIDNARLFEAEKKQRQEAEILREATAALTTTIELETLYKIILDALEKLVPYDSASIDLLDQDYFEIVAEKYLPKKHEYVGRRIKVHSYKRASEENKQWPLIISDVQADERFEKMEGTEYIRGWMGVPMVARDKLIGYLNLDSRKVGFYTQEHTAIAQTFGNQAAIAIENARLFETEQRRHSESETLRQTAEAVTSSLDIRQVLNAILNNLNRVVPFDSAALFLVEGDKVRLTAGMGFPENEEAVDSLFPASNALLQDVWKIGKPLILEDAQADPRFENCAAANHVRGWMGVPLAARGVMIGCIEIDSHKARAYNEHDATLAMTFAHQAAFAIENARLYDRSEQQIRQLTILRDIDSAISSSFDLSVTLSFITNHAVKELSANAAAILLYDPELESLSINTQIGFSNERPPYSSYIRIGEGLGGKVALNRKLVQILDLSSLPEHKTSILVAEDGFKSYFGIPLIGKGQIKGVLEIYSRTEIHPTTEWLNFLQTLAGQAAIAIDSVELFKNLHRSNLELTLAYDTTLAGWGRALELRDKETQGHTNRVVKLTVELARRMGVSGEYLTRIMRGTLLHDIGKMGIPDNILNKPGPLSEEEWDIMRQHPQFAYNLIYPIPYLRSTVEIPYGHHERWDGSGYPQGLKGEEIPLAARLFAVVDIYDALMNDRVYRKAWPEEKVIEYLKNAAGIELDPAIVEKFLEMLKKDRYTNQVE